MNFDVFFQNNRTKSYNKKKGTKPYIFRKLKKRTYKPYILAALDLSSYINLSCLSIKELYIPFLSIKISPEK